MKPWRLVVSNRFSNFARLPCCLLLLIAVACADGCGKQANKGTVSGSVTLDGQPLPTGIIRFVPADGGTSTADGQIKDGRFSVSAPPGEKRVSISAQKVIGKKASQMPGSPMLDVTEEIVPARFNVQTTLTYTVTVDSQQKDFDLKSGK